MTSRLRTWNQEVAGSKAWDYIIPAEQIRANLLPTKQTQSSTGLRSGALMAEFSRDDIDQMSDSERRILDIIDFKYYFDETRGSRAVKTLSAVAASGYAFAYFRKFVITLAERLRESNDSLPTTQAEWADSFQNFVGTHKTALDIGDRIQAVAMKGGLMCQACANELAFPRDARPVTEDEREAAKKLSDVQVDATLDRRQKKAVEWADKAKKSNLTDSDLKRITSPLVKYVVKNRNVSATDTTVRDIKNGLLGSAAATGAAAALMVPGVGVMAAAAAIGGVAGYWASASAEKAPTRHECGIYGAKKADKPVMPSLATFVEHRDRFINVLRHCETTDMETTPEDYDKLAKWRDDANEAALCVSIAYIHTIAQTTKMIRDKCKAALGRYLRSHNTNHGATASGIKFTHTDLDKDLGLLAEAAANVLKLTINPDKDAITPEFVFSLVLAVSANDSTTVSWSPSTNWREIQESLKAADQAGHADTDIQAWMMAILFSQLDFASGVSDGDVDKAMDVLQAQGTQYLAVIINRITALNISIESARESLLCAAGAFIETPYGENTFTANGKETRYEKAPKHTIACPADTPVGQDPNYWGRGRRRVCVTKYDVCESDLYRRTDADPESYGVYAIIKDVRALLSGLTETKPSQIKYASKPVEFVTDVHATTAMIQKKIKQGESLRLMDVVGEKCKWKRPKHFNPTAAFRSVSGFYHRILKALGTKDIRAVVKDDREASFYTPKFTKYLFSMALAKLDGDPAAATEAVVAEEEGEAAAAAAAVAAVADDAVPDAPLTWQKRFQRVEYDDSDWMSQPTVRVYDTKEKQILTLINNDPIGLGDSEWQTDDGTTIASRDLAELPADNFRRQHYDELEAYDE